MSVYGGGGGRPALPVGCCFCLCLLVLVGLHVVYVVLMSLFPLCLSPQRRLLVPALPCLWESPLPYVLVVAGHFVSAPSPSSFGRVTVVMACQVPILIMCPSIYNPLLGIVVFVVVVVVFGPLPSLLQELEDLRRKYMTKKGPVQKVMGQMRLLSSEDKVGGRGREERLERQEKATVVVVVVVVVIVEGKRDGIRPAVVRVASKVARNACLPAPS